MRLRLSNLYYLNHHDRRILLVLLTVAVVALALMFVVGGRNDTSEIAHSIEKSEASEKLGATADSGTSTPQYYAQPERPVERFMFDPNTADSTQLLRLGLQAWQVGNIY